ncbi:hypothetical protein CDD80_6541 [Ophiocordyceps camponoti-rufipedis]|uniref:FAD-binding PCMH-type domain-containing protein n=1 Tax=Ophiocordyceps camponoti-rufipedis TaxID=2004952 RepID=A0A2C5XSH6_9HYPO|nr:hypothetical protein CDD80_6541 [Ophiocordyceps camponoti-rufipedis]
MTLRSLWARRRLWRPRLGDAQTAALQLVGFATWIPLILWFNLHVAEVTWVDGGSMSPLLNGDRDTTLKRDAVLNFKWAPQDGLKRGMVVTLRSPYRPESVVVKRVVALPGDVVLTKRPYSSPVQRVPPGHVWVEGDGPPGSSLDSNTYGPVSMRLLTGRVTHILYPLRSYQQQPATYLTMKLAQSATLLLLLQTATAWTQWPKSGSLAQHTSNSIIEELGPLLSEGATVVSPSWPEAAPLLDRAAYPRISPGYAAIVQVKTEQDVQQTIKYANRRHIPFLAVSGGHGWLSTLNRVQGGIQINMRYLNHTRLHADGKTVSVGGGTLQREVTAALFAKGKRAVTGICACVSVIAPLLGGGHSLLQGRYGFAADNLVSAEVVLADGSIVTASADENADLFWGLRGAGHNLGIVTAFDVRVHDDGEHGWTSAVLVFTHEKLEAFLGVWNELEDRYSDRGLLIMFAWVSRNDTVDGHRPVITMRMVSERDTPALADFLTAFRKLKPLQDSTSDLPWSEAQAAALDPRSCSVNNNLMAFPNSFDRWDIAAMRRGFNLFADLVSDDAFAGSQWILESYGNKAVRQVPLSENAVPAEERRYDILTAFSIVWEGQDDDRLLKARDMGNRMQEATRSADEPHHVYLNYAQGSEALQQVYGADEERLARLRELYCSETTYLSRKIDPEPSSTMDPPTETELQQDRKYFPPLSALPVKGQIDEPYYVSTDGVHYKPAIHWCFLGEIVQHSFHTRLRVLVRDRAGKLVPIAFHTEDLGLGFLRSGEVKVGNTVAVLYAEKHDFGNSVVGICQKTKYNIKVLPGSLDNLKKLSKRLRMYFEVSQGIPTCHNCHEKSTSLLRCDCQAVGWHEKGHKEDCKILRDSDFQGLLDLDWSRFDMFLEFADRS